MQPERQRLASIDWLRGLVMLLMVLDHSRDFVHREGLTADPMDPATTYPWLFATRWVTHFCAPTFVFLAGLSVHLQLQRGGEPAAVARRLWRRGLGLVLLELVVLRPLIWFQLDLSFAAHLQVIWAIGWSMCGLALLLRLPPIWPLLLGTAIVVGHGLVSNGAFRVVDAGSLAALQMLLIGRGAIEFGSGGPIAVVQYAIVPWFGVMLLGYGAGPLYRMAAKVRRAWLLGLGLAASAAFVALRVLHGYGDPTPWNDTAHGPPLLYSFLNVAKYPPSLQYDLMTLGPALLLLAVCDGVRRDGVWSMLVRIGRVPLFFYVLQWPSVHLVSRAFQWLDGQPVGWDAPNPLLEEPLPPGCGFSLGVVYLAWGVCLLVLVPVSLAYDRWRTHRRATGSDRMVQNPL